MGSGVQGTAVLSDLAVGIERVTDEGTFITQRADEFVAYLRLVERYSHILHTIETRRTIQYEPLMRAADRDILAVSLQTPGQSRVVLLPTPTIGSLDDGIGALLASPYGLAENGQEAPDWLEDITLPTEDELKNELERVTAQLTPLLDRKLDLNDRITVARAPLGVLYESGLALEGLVHELLDELGGNVLPPPTIRRTMGLLKRLQVRCWC